MRQTCFAAYSAWQTWKDVKVPWCWRSADAPNLGQCGVQHAHGHLGYLWRTKVRARSARIRLPKQREQWSSSGPPRPNPTPHIKALNNRLEFWDCSCLESWLVELPQTDTARQDYMDVSSRFLSGPFIIKVPFSYFSALIGVP